MLVQSWEVCHERSVSFRYHQQKSQINLSKKLEKSLFKKFFEVTSLKHVAYPPKNPYQKKMDSTKLSPVGNAKMCRIFHVETRPLDKMNLPPFELSTVPTSCGFKNLYWIYPKNCTHFSEKIHGVWKISTITKFPRGKSNSLYSYLRILKCSCSLPNVNGKSIYWFLA